MDRTTSQSLEMESDHQYHQCNKVFTMKKNLNHHIRTVHDKVKKHECGICSKKFSRKQNKELHIKTCSISVGMGLSKKSHRIIPDLKFSPRLESSGFNGIATDWMINYSNDYKLCDPMVLLQSSVKTMKDMIVKQLYEQTMRLKFTMSIHAVFEQVVDIAVPGAVVGVEQTLGRGEAPGDYFVDGIQVMGLVAAVAAENGAAREPLA